MNSSVKKMLMKSSERNVSTLVSIRYHIKLIQCTVYACCEAKTLGSYKVALFPNGGNVSLTRNANFSPERLNN